jgi:hypothetical protein
MGGSIILKWKLRKQVGKMPSGFIWPRIESVGGLFVNTAMNLQVPEKLVNFLIS